MRIAIIAVVVIIVGVGVAGVCYHSVQADAEKQKASDYSDTHISAEFKQPARYALSILDRAPGSGEAIRAMAAANAAKTKRPDHFAMLMLESYQVAIETFHGAESDKVSLRACSAVAHSLIEGDAEVTDKTMAPCMNAK